MAQDKNTIAQTYAKALFEVASVKDRKKVLTELTELTQIVGENPKLVTALDGKRLSDKEKQSLLKVLGKTAKTKVTTNLLRLLVDNRRFYTLSQVKIAFEQLLNEANSTVSFTATTAVPMSDTQLKKLTTILKKKLAVKAVTLTNQVDQSIVGGVILQSDTQLIDGSVKTRFSEIKKQLKAAQV